MSAQSRSSFGRDRVDRTPLTSVSRSRPCPVCDGDHKCSVGQDGLIFCGRVSGPVEGFVCLGSAKGDPQFTLYRFAGQDGLRASAPAPGAARRNSPRYDARAGQLQAALTEEARSELLASLGIPEEYREGFAAPLAGLGVGYDASSRRFTFPERDASGAIIGLHLRARSGRKKMEPGSRRGLCFDPGAGLDAAAGGPEDTDLFLPEGGSDTLVLRALGLGAVGRPSNTGGVDHLVDLLDDLPRERRVIVLGENDRKPDGRCPGLDGAVGTAGRLAGALGRPVAYALPQGAKDIRDWFQKKLPEVGGLAWPEARQRLRDELLAELRAAATDVASGEGDEAWAAPLPLEADRLPAFPTDALSGWLKEHVEALAEATQTPPDLAGLLALAATAAACARVVAVRVKAGYVEPVNLFVAPALPPGSRKSAVFAAMTEPHAEYERELVAEAAPRIAEAQARLKLDKRTQEELEKQASKAKPDQRDALARQAVELAARIAEAEVPISPRLISDDATSESLERQVADQGGRMAVLSAEGGVFDVMAGRYGDKGRAGNIEIYLKGHAGDDLRVDRLSRPPIFVRRPALTVGLAVQPEVLRNLGGNRAFRGRGLLARFLYAVPASTVGRRDVDPEPLPEEVRREYRSRMRSLLQLGAGTGQGGGSDPREISLWPDAYGLWLGFSRWVEPQLGEHGAMGEMADWGGKLAGAVARIAGLLHMADHAGHREPWTLPISAEVMERAIQIGRYLVPHARAAFALMGQDPAVEDARYTLTWVRRLAAETGSLSFAKRDLFERVKGRFPRVEQLDPSLEMLCRHGYLRPREPGPRTGPGRAASPVYEINPMGLEGASPPSSPSPPEGRSTERELVPADAGGTGEGGAAGSEAPVAYEEGRI